MSHRDPFECSDILTRLRLTHYGYRLTVLRNEFSDTDCNCLNQATGNFHRFEQSNICLIYQTACGRPPKGVRISKFCITWFMNGLLVLFQSVLAFHESGQTFRYTECAFISSSINIFYRLIQEWTKTFFVKWMSKCPTICMSCHPFKYYLTSWLCNVFVHFTEIVLGM